MAHDLSDKTHEDYDRKTDPKVGCRMIITQTRGNTDASSRGVVEAQVSRHGWEDLEWETVETEEDDRGRVKTFDRLSGWRAHGKRGGVTSSKVTSAITSGG